MNNHGNTDLGTESTLQVPVNSEVKVNVYCKHEKECLPTALWLNDTVMSAGMQSTIIGVRSTEPI